MVDQYIFGNRNEDISNLCSVFISDPHIRCILDDLNVHP
jgi:hypothetical protein